MQPFIKIESLSNVDLLISLKHQTKTPLKIPIHKKTKMIQPWVLHLVGMIRAIRLKLYTSQHTSRSNNKIGFGGAVLEKANTDTRGDALKWNQRI